MNGKVDSDSKLKNFLLGTSNVAGSAIGNFLGALTNDPTLAGTAGATGAVITLTLNDVIERTLSKNEKSRIANASANAYDRITKNFENNLELRNDDFFYPTDIDRSSAEEIFEAVLLKCKNEHEEKKLPFISNIFANVAFDKQISVYEANQMVKIAERLTYRQFVILSLIFRQNDYTGIKENLSKKSGENVYDYRKVAILQETYELWQLGLIYTFEDGVTIEKQMEDGKQHNPFALLGWGNIVPSGIVLSDIGEKFYCLLNLNEISQSDTIVTSRLFNF